MLFMKKLAFDAVRNRYSTGSVLSTLVEGSIRFLQFVLAVAVIGLYAQDLVRAKSNGDSLDSKWVSLSLLLLVPLQSPSSVLHHISILPMQQTEPDQGMYVLDSSSPPSSAASRPSHRSSLSPYRASHVNRSAW